MNITRKFYVDTLTPVLERHGVPKRIRPAIIRYYTDVAPKATALEAFSQRPGWTALVRACDTAVNRQYVANLFGRV